MKQNFPFYEIKYFFKKNQKIYISFLIFLLLGIALGIIIASSSDSYLSLLTSSDKLFYDYVNGKVSFSKQFTRMIVSSVILNLIFFMFSLNFYVSMFSYLVMSYQGLLMFLSVTAVISEFGFRGILMTIFLILPVNLILLAESIVFASICLERCYAAHRNKTFSHGFQDKIFWTSIFWVLLIDIIISIAVTMIIGLLIRSRIFIIF